MPPARVLFVAEAISPIHPGWMLTLARSLDPARFSPVLAWHPRYNAQLGPLEFPFFPLPTILPRQFFGGLSQFHFYFGDANIEHYVAWDLEVFREAAPDVVVGGVRPSLVTSTAVARLPYVNIVGAHWSPYARDFWSWLNRRVEHRLRTLSRQVVLSLLQPFMSYRASRGLIRVGAQFGYEPEEQEISRLLSRGDWVLYPDVPEVVPTRGAPANHRYMGPIVWRPPTPGGAPPVPAGDGPLVYVDLSPAGTDVLMEKVLRALDRLGARALVAAPDRSLFGGHRRAHFQFPLPGPDVVPGVDVVVCGGGIGTAIPALQAGIPLLGLSGNIDQGIYMQHVVSKGLGLHLPAARATEDSVAGALRTLLEKPAFRRRAVEVAVAMKTRRDRNVLAETLDRCLENRGHRAPPCSERALGTPAPARRLSDKEAHDIANAALWAPSAGNSQPLLFRGVDGGLEVCVDPLRNNRFMDTANSDLWIALGAAVANMEAVVNQRGEGLVTRLFPRDARGGLLARVDRTDVAGDAGPLAPWIERRVTNRRPYAAEVPSADQLSSLGAWAVSSDVRLTWITDRGAIREVAEALSVFDRITLHNRLVGKTILRWVRTPTEEGRGDGLSYDSLELGPLERFVMRFIRTAWGAWVGRWVAGRVAANARDRCAASGAIGVLTVGAWDAAAMVDGGRAFQRLWLAAAREGLSLHPLVGMVLFEMRRRLATEAGVTPREKEWLEAARATIARHAPEFAERVPLVIFRMGRSEAPTGRSYRRPLEEVYGARSLEIGPLS
jgi:UDP:flavonoid glycosyltransferase YjiC (YdhE family)/nitroreductase